MFLITNIKGLQKLQINTGINKKVNDVYGYRSINIYTKYNLLYLNIIIYIFSFDICIYFLIYTVFFL